MIRIENLVKRYNGKRALEGIDLELPRGEIIGLFGENGAGKTTLMKCILGFVNYSGTITLDGEPITRKNIAKISLATNEHSYFPNLTPHAHREFYAEHFEKFSDKRFTGLMEFFELPLHKPVNSFSTGQKNQFEVIMSLCQGADYILMDEPFATSDIFNREDFYKVMLGLLEEHETVLLSTHLIEEVSGVISRAVLLRQGRLIADLDMSDVEESGGSLVNCIKDIYSYRADRVSRAINDLGDTEEEK